MHFVLTDSQQAEIVPVIPALRQAGIQQSHL
jgi:hypothetical protein